MAEITVARITGDWRRVVGDEIVTHETPEIGDAGIHGTVTLTPVWPKTGPYGVIADPAAHYSIHPVVCRVRYGRLYDSTNTHPYEDVVVEIGGHPLVWSAQFDLAFRRRTGEPEVPLQVRGATFDSSAMVAGQVSLTGILPTSVVPDEYQSYFTDAAVAAGLADAARSGAELAAAAADVAAGVASAKAADASAAAADADASVGLAAAEADRAVGLATAQDQAVADTVLAGGPTTTALNATYGTKAEVAEKLDEASAAATFTTRSEIGTQVNPDNAFATLAAHPVAMPPTPYGHSDYTHPSVLHFPAGWNGWKYWMAITPMPANGDSKQENPCIYVSNDGQTWQAPAGLTNPLHGPPTTTQYAYYADTELVMDGATMYCFFTRNDSAGNASNYAGMYMTSTDGVTWAGPNVSYQWTIGERRLLSPTIQIVDGVWHLWAQEGPSNRIVYATSNGPTGWTIPEPCTITPALPAGRESWHLEVSRVGTEWHMLLADNLAGTAGGGCDLYFLASTDGVHWRRGRSPITPRVSPRGRQWYRSSMVPRIEGGVTVYDAWLNYYGQDSTGLIRRLIRATIRFAPGLADTEGQAVQSMQLARQSLPPFKAADDFNRPDGPLGTAVTGQPWIVHAGSPAIVDREVAGTGERRAVLDVGAADVWIETTSRRHVAASAGGVVFWATDADNYWLFGWSNGLELVCYKNGARQANSWFSTLSTPSVLLATTPADPPTRIGVRVRGKTITRFINGSQLGDPVVLSDTAAANLPKGTMHGIYLNNNAGVLMHGFTVRAL